MRLSLAARGAENQLPTSSFIEASDVDNENSLPDESQESVYYYLIDGNRDNFAIEDRTMARLKTVRALDREEPPRDLFVIVETSNEDRQFPSADCSRTDCSQASFLNITIEVNPHHHHHHHLLVSSPLPSFDTFSFPCA